MVRPWAINIWLLMEPRCCRQVGSGESGVKPPPPKNPLIPKKPLVNKGSRHERHPLTQVVLTSAHPFNMDLIRVGSSRFCVTSWIVALFPGQTSTKPHETHSKSHNQIIPPAPRATRNAVF